MRTSTKLTLIILFMLTTNLYAQENKPDAIIVKGLSLWSPSSDSVKEIFTRLFAWQTDVINITELGKYDFSGVKVLYFPGGGYTAMKLPPNGAENLSRAIANGMGYIGTCGGALIMAEKTPTGETIGVFPGYEPFGGGYENRNYLFDCTNPIIKNSTVSAKITPEMVIHYYGGPTDFILHESAIGGYKNWILARDKKSNKPAIIVLVHGKGRVMLISPHPERPLSLPPKIAKAHQVIQMAAEWTTHKSDPKTTSGITVIPNIPTTGKSRQPLTFSATDTQDELGYPLGYTWNFGDGSPPTYTPKANHSFNASGIYEITLGVTDGRRTKTIRQSITITPQPILVAPVIKIHTPFKHNEIAGVIPVELNSFLPSQGATNGAGIRKVELVLKNNGTICKTWEWTQAPYTTDLDTNTLADGKYTFTARCESDNLQTSSTDTPIVIKNKLPPPVPPALPLFHKLSADIKNNVPTAATALNTLLRTRGHEILQYVALKPKKTFSQANNTWFIHKGYWLTFDNQAFIGNAFSEAYAYLNYDLPDNLQIDATLISTHGHTPEISIWFAGNPEKLDCAGYFVSVSNNGGKLQRDGKTVLQTTQPVIRFNERYHLTVRRIGNTITAFLDGAEKPFIKWTDSNPIHGENHRRAGVYIWCGTEIVESFSVKDLSAANTE